jgi:hypothetical protein
MEILVVLLMICWFLFFIVSIIEAISPKCNHYYMGGRCFHCLKDEPIKDFNKPKDIN